MQLSLGSLQGGAGEVKCLITGSGGFIGSHLVKALEERGDEVIKVPHLSLRVKPQELTVFLYKTNPDYIFHLSAYGNMSHQKDWGETFNANLEDTYNLLMASKDIPYKAFINVSSSSVLLPYQTMYSATKLGAEALCKAFVDEYDKIIPIARPSTVIGKGEQSQHLIPTLIRSCMTGEEMPFVPNATHDFIDVRDVVDGLILLAEKGVSQVYNISSNTKYSNEQVKDIVEDITGKKANVKIVESLRSYDNGSWRVENNRMRDESWTPKYSLEEGVESML